MKYILYVWVLMMFPMCGNSQYLLGASTTWSDSFTEWELFIEVNDEVVEGELETIFGLGKNLDDWKYDVGRERGTIKKKFSSDEGNWELLSDDQTVSIRQVWPSDPSEWRISNGDIQMTLKTKWTNSGDEWLVTTSDVGDFIIYSEYKGDPRDWLIEDYMIDQIPFEMRMAATFITLYVTMPK